MSTENHCKPDDKAWMKERRAEWRQVKMNLDSLSAVYPPFKKSNHKFHKELFFTGVQILKNGDRIHFDDEQKRQNFYQQSAGRYLGLLPVFILWYHPKPSASLVSQLKTEFVHFGKINRAQDIFFQNWITALPIINNKWDVNYGMLNGREKMATQVLCHGIDYALSIDVHTCSPKQYMTQERPCPLPDEIFYYCLNGTRHELLSDARHYPNSPGQFLWNNLSYAIENYPDEIIKNDFNQVRARIEGVIARVLDFENSKDTSRNRPTTIALVESLIAKYENKEFSDSLLNIWDGVRTNHRKILKTEHKLYNLTAEEIEEMYEHGGGFTVAQQNARIAQWAQI